MAKVTNNSKARQGIRVGSTVKWVAPGDAYEGDMTQDEMDRHARHAFLKIEGSAKAPKPAGLTGKSKDDLLAIAKSEGVGETIKVDDKDVPIAETTIPQITAAIEAKRKAA